MRNLGKHTKLLSGGIVVMAALAAATTVFAQEKGPIKILALDVTSGAFKDIGDRYQMGVKFAVDEINASGGINGRPITLLVDDSQLNPQVAQRKALKYILDEGVKIIIGGTGSNVVKALAQVSNSNQTALVLYSGEDDAITGADFNPSVFRLALSTSMHANATVAGLANRPEKQFYFLNQDYSFGHSVVASYKKALDRMKPGWKQVGEDYHPLNTKDFSPYLQKIAASKAEMVLSGDWGADLTTLVRQAANFGMKKPFGQIFLSDPVAMKVIGDAGIGGVTSEIYMVGVENAKNNAFVERWHKQFKDTENPWPEFAIGKGYNTMMFLAAAMKKANSEKLDPLVKAWEGMAFDGTMGHQVMRACDHQVQSDVAVAEIVAGPGKFYPFAYSGPVTMIPAATVGVPPKETGNKRCEAL
jgi:ABC-type branched-subunit amino acid transport system substrate-binding protein